MGKFGTGACWTAVRSNRPVTFVAIAAWTALAAHSGMDQVHSGMDHLYGFHIICFMGGASMVFVKLRERDLAFVLGRGRRCRRGAWRRACRGGGVLAR